MDLYTCDFALFDTGIIIGTQTNSETINNVSFEALLVFYSQSFCSFEN